MTALVVAALTTQAAAQRAGGRLERPARSRKSLLPGLKALAADNDRVEMKTLVARPHGAYMRFAVSSDLRHYACIGPFERGKPAQLVIDGVEKGPKRVYGRPSMFFLGDAAVASFDGEGRQVAVNGELWPGTGEPSGWTVSPDGKHIALVIGNRNGSTSLILDGKVVAQARTIHRVTFSPDSKRLACHVTTEPRKDSPWANWEIPWDQWLWADGKLAGPYSYIGDIQFSRDSKRLACTAKTVVDGNKRGVIILDGKAIAMGKRCGIAGFDAEGRLLYMAAEKRSGADTFVMDARNVVKKLPGAAYLSPDGKRIAWVVPAGPESRRVVVGGKEQTAYTTIKHVTFAPVGDSIAYIASNDRKTHLAVVDDKVVATSKGFEYPIFSPNGRRVALIAHPEGLREWNKHELVIDGKSYPAAELMSEPKVRFSADGKHWMATARHGENRRDWQYEVLWDGKSVGRFERLLGTSRMTHDGKPVFAAFKSRTSVAVYVGNKSGPTYESVTLPRVSDNGRRVAYAAKDADGVCAVVLDGQTFTVPTMPTRMEFIDADTLRAFFRTQGYGGYALVDFKVGGIP